MVMNMTTIMLDLFHYQFMQYAALAGVLASIAAGILGAYVVVRRNVFMGSGLSHAAFGGIGLGILLGVNPVAVAIPFTVLAAVLMGHIQKRTRLGEDAGIGILWTVGMALGVIFIHFAPGYAPDLSGYLFGSILAVTATDLFILAVLDLIILGVVLLFERELTAISFDEELAVIVGMPVRALYYLFLALVAGVIIALIKMVGVVLVTALLAMPAVIGRRFVNDMRKLMVLSVVISLAATYAGLAASYYLDMPAGSVIVLVLAVAFFLTAAAKKA